MFTQRLRGQTLVEVAVMLPVVCIAIVVTIQIIASCHNAVLLQRMAFEAARAVSSETSPRSLLLFGGKLWGRGAVPVRHRSTEILNPWRPFNALSRVTDPGHITSIDIQSLYQHATAEAPLEPPAPVDD